MSCVQYNGDVKLGTVGKAFPNTVFRPTESGEVISRSPGVFVGYYKNPEATAETAPRRLALLGRRGHARPQTATWS